MGSWPRKTFAENPNSTLTTHMVDSNSSCLSATLIITLSSSHSGSVSFPHLCPCPSILPLLSERPIFSDLLKDPVSSCLTTLQSSSFLGRFLWFHDWFAHSPPHGSSWVATAYLTPVNPELTPQVVLNRFNPPSIWASEDRDHVPLHCWCLRQGLVCSWPSMSMEEGSHETHPAALI